MFGRDAAKREAGAKRARCAAAPWEEAARFHADVLINATPLGMRHQPASPVSFAQARCEVAFDLVYSPPITPFLRAAAGQGARILTGLSMFLEQALLQFEILTGYKAQRSLFEEILAPYQAEGAA
jgi:shikimate 5-dehydrogenase